jgi:hypothetical protein
MADERDPSVAAVVSACHDAAEAVARLGGNATREDTAKFIRAEAGRVGAGAATLVVVGEKKRGKTSLVNALVGQADLLPVEVDVATSVHIEVHYADEPYARAYLQGETGPQPIELSQIADYASMDPTGQQPRREDVLYVRVGIPAPILARGLALVDTPGVGGLISGHSRLTLAALDLADALIFVVNGSSELTRSELTFLERATGRIATVYFVLTATDKYEAWQHILERNQKLLREHAPRYQDCPWFAVSSRAKLDADAASSAGDAALAAIRYEESGFKELTNAIGDGAGLAAERLRARNALYVALAAVDPLLAAHERQLRSLALDEGLVDEIQAREAAVGRLQEQDAAWRSRLATRVQELGIALGTDFQHSVNDLRNLVEEKISTVGADELAEIAGDLEVGIRAAWMGLASNADAGIARISAELGREFSLAGVDEVAVQLELPDRLRKLPTLVGQVGDDTGGFERLVVATGSGMAVYSALNLVTGGLFTPIIAGIGVTIMLIGQRKRREELQRRRGDADRYLQRVLNELYVDGPPRIEQSMVLAHQQLEQTIADRLALASAHMRAELDEYYVNLQAAEQELAEQRERVGADTESLRQVARRLAELQDGLGEQ